MTMSNTEQPGKLTPLKAADFYREAVAEFEEAHGSLYSRRTFTNVDTKTSIRPSFTRDDYSYFRPEDGIPSESRQVMLASRFYYNTVGIIRNVLDMMSDFASQGIRVESPDAEAQATYQKWFNLVGGRLLSERFLHTLYCQGNVIIKVREGKLSNTLVTLPARYTILDATKLKAIGGELAQFLEQHEYSMTLPVAGTNLIRKGANRTKAENKVLARLDPDVRAALEAGKRELELDSDDLRTFFYKRQHHEVWAQGIIAAILEDIILLQKTKLCDLAALDGAISNVRLWNLGSLDHQLAPAPGAANRLARMLENNVGGGTIDIIWGPDLTLKESNTNVHKFLGQEKYAATLANIYAGLGVPQSLTGGSQSNSGFTNNFISLKTLVERLEYGRTQLLSFWQAELTSVQDALGLSSPPFLRFDQMTLSDAAAEKALLVQLLDRQIISDETVLQRFGELPAIESVRLQRESDLRSSGDKPDKLGPFVASAPEDGASTSETPKKGRPRNARDETKRKQKRVLPRSGKNKGAA